MEFKAAANVELVRKKGLMHQAPDALSWSPVHPTPVSATETQLQSVISVGISSTEEKIDLRVMANAEELDSVAKSDAELADPERWLSTWLGI